MYARAHMLAGLSLLALTISVPAAAQNAPTDEDSNIIIVTATKRDANLQDIPFSINAQTAEDIQKSGAVTLEDLSRNVAGLSVQNLGPGQSQVSVRGVSAGQVVRDQPGVKEQVGVYLDESVISLSLFTPDGSNWLNGHAGAAAADGSRRAIDLIDGAEAVPSFQLMSRSLIASVIRALIQLDEYTAAHIGTNDGDKEMLFQRSNFLFTHSLAFLGQVSIL